jgi:NAD-dependent deacetylase
MDTPGDSGRSRHRGWWDDSGDRWSAPPLAFVTRSPTRGRGGRGVRAPCPAASAPLQSRHEHTIESRESQVLHGARHVTGDAVERAAAVLVSARRVVVSTGAGMSAESGIPTFRDALDGLWSRFDPRSSPRRRGSARTRGACGAGTRGDARASPPARRTRALRGRRAPAAPAPAREPRHPERGRAARRRRLERSRRAARKHPAAALPGRRAPVRRATFPRRPLPNGGGDAAPCPRCGSPLRPCVVWFGEMLPADAVERAWAAAKRATRCCWWAPPAPSGPRRSCRWWRSARGARHRGEPRNARS